MIIQCSACQARYHYDESRFGGAASKKIRCTKCSVVFEIRNPAGEDTGGASKASVAPAPRSGLPGHDEFTLDETAMTEPGRRKQAPGAPARAMPLVVPKSAVPQPPPPPVPAMTGPIPSMPAPQVGMTSAAARTTDRVPVAGAAASAAEKRLRLPGSYRLSLACIAGPDSGRIFEIDKARIVIGRANADIVLADIQCSRNHAALEVQDDKVTLVDLSSTNGTYVGDQRINRLELENRSEFEIGTTTLMLIRSATDATAEA